MGTFSTNPSLTNHRREHILKMAAKYATLHEDGIKGWLCQWFKGCDFNELHRENVVQFLKWAFFLDPKCDDDEKQQKWNESFIEFAIDRIESLTDHPLRKGLNPNISFVHNTDDAVPLSTTYRPFLFYLFLWIGQQITDLILYSLRFEYRYVNGLRVWYKVQSKNDGKESTPIMSVHGLGVHFMPYIPMIYKLITKSSRNDMVCIEIPWTAMSIWHFIPDSLWRLFSNEPSPSYITSKRPLEISDFIGILQEMERVILDENEFNEFNDSSNGLSALSPLTLRWTLIGHSYGSFIVSGIYHEITRDHSRGIPDEVRLPRLVLLDPVTLCLTQPTTVSFLMLDANGWATWMMQHLASKELMIACTLRKYFHWFEVNLYPEDLINEQVEHIVVTAKLDSLVPGQLIRKGIEGVNVKNEQEGHRVIHHLDLGDLHHALWLLSPSCIQRIVDAI